MKQYYITSNVNDRNATAKNLANGEKFDVWFTSGTVRHYDEQGNLICTESGTMNWDEVERIDPTEDKTMYVGFNFGSYVYLTVSIHEGLTLDECVCLRGQGDIDTYKTDSGEWVKCEADYEETLEKLHDLRNREEAEDKVVHFCKETPIPGCGMRAEWRELYPVRGKIKFVRMYKQYRENWYDVVYHSGRVCTYTEPYLPDTVQRFVDSSEIRKEQYDKAFHRDEMIYW